jgi:hypothetical protein
VDAAPAKKRGPYEKHRNVADTWSPHAVCRGAGYGVGAFPVSVWRIPLFLYRLSFRVLRFMKFQTATLPGALYRHQILMKSTLVGTGKV